MKIIFIGDLHFDNSDSTAGVKLDFANPVKDNPIMPILDLLEKRYRDDKISLLVFLGDYSNAKMPEETKKVVFKLVRDFAEQIEAGYSSIFDNTGNIKDRIVFIDGNHDVIRGEGHHELFAGEFADYLTPYTNSIGDECKKNGAPVFDFTELNTLLACISTTQNAGAHFANVDDLLPLVESMKTSDPTKYSAVLKIIEKVRSADIGSVTSDTIDNFKRCSGTERKTKIVVSHHPLIPMQRATAVHFDTVNGGFFLETARAKGFSYFVHGHLHEFNCVEIESKGKNSDLPTATLIGVPMFISSDGQQFVELDITNEGYICRHLRVDKIRDRIEEVDVATSKRHVIPSTQNEHFLLDYEIQRLIEEGKIVKNASSERIEAVAYDCSIGLFYKRYDYEKNVWPDEVITMEPVEKGPAKITLEPGETVLLYTHEEFDIPNDMMLHASPRATLKRRGIDVDVSFFVEPGFCGPFCFPVTNKNKRPVEISAQEAVMSVVFHRLSGTVDHGWKDRHPSSKDRRVYKRDT